MTPTAQQSSIRGKHLPPSPHGQFEELFDGIWFVRGGVKMPMLMPMKIGRSMSVVRGDEGNLTLFNSMRLVDDGLKQLEALGNIANVVRLAGFHGRDDGFYRDRYGARVFAIEGQQYIRGLGKDWSKDKEYMQPDEWLSEGGSLPIGDAKIRVFKTSKPREGVVVLEREGGILIAGDSLQHTPQADEFFNLPAKIMMKRLGFLKPYNVGPGWLQFASPARSEVRAILELSFEHVLPAHGDAVLGNAKEKYRASIEGELKGCH